MSGGGGMKDKVLNISLVACRIFSWYTMLSKVIMTD